MVLIISIDIVQFIVRIYVLQESLCFGIPAWRGKNMGRKENEMCQISKL
jgi:hypothetical protein